MYKAHIPPPHLSSRRIRWRDHFTPYLSGLALLGAIVLLGACASSQRRGSPFSGGGERAEIRIEVLNLNFNDATLWAIGDGTRRKLGVVSGKNASAFTIPWRLSGPLAIQIDILAGVRCVTQEMMTDPGDIIELQIPADFRRSEVCR
jgi:hypothetical protein